MILRYFLLTSFSLLVTLANGQLNLDLLLHNNLDQIDLSQLDVRNYQVTDQYSSHTNDIIHVYLIQTADGIPIKDARMSLATDHKGKVYHIAHRFLKDIVSYKVESRFGLDEFEAFNAACIVKAIDYGEDLMLVNDEEGESAYKANSVAKEEYIQIRKILYREKYKLNPAYEIDVFSDQLNEWWQIIIDATSGALVDEIPWTLTCSWEVEDGCGHDHDHTNHRHEKKKEEVILNSPVAANTYQVFAMPLSDPDDGVRTIVTAPWTNAPTASPFGWHDTNGVAGAEYTVTRGNNVRACEDRNANNSCGFSPNGGMSLDFQYPLNLATENPVVYQDVAVTNLFYWNNIMHDVWYIHGFDEPAGNFQENNYGNGGAASDGVNADAQDGSGTNNANFSAPTDGSNPRMQMFEWSVSGALTVDVNSPAGIAGSYGASGANFGATSGIYTADVVQATPNLACTAITNGAAVSGKIAMVDRGSCNFTNKVLAAQNVGAIAVIVCNNVGGAPITMGGTNGNITIPAVMLSMADCNTLKANMPSPGVNATINLNLPTLRDSDLDNTVIAHEYGHGISIRLAGGPGTSSCLNTNEQMGEGWSDWFGLMISIESGDLGTDLRGMGAYLTGEAQTSNGIRTYPYTTDILSNPHTYNDISSASVPHGVGSVWCAMLWEMTWGLIDEHGFNTNFYGTTGGNNIAKKLVIEGLKLIPCGPGFVDGRDAILAADNALYGGANQCIIWEAFAKRGLGLSASQGSANNNNDGVEAYDIPTGCTEILKIDKTSQAIAYTNMRYSYSVNVTNNKATAVTNVMIRDTVDANLNLILGSLSLGSLTGNVISYDQANLGSMSNIILNYQMQSTRMDSSEIIQYDGFESAHTSLWTPMTGQGTGVFAVNTNNPKRGSNNIFVPNNPANNTQFLESQSLSFGNQPLLSFWHSYNTESGWDGGYVQVSTNGGSTWSDIILDEFVLSDYNGTLGSGSNNDIAGKKAFTGNSNGYIRTIIDLSAYANQTGLIRFVFGSDDNTVSVGWYIDEVNFYDALFVRNNACVTTNQDPEICDEVRTLMLPACEDYNIYYIDADMDGYGDINSPDIYGCALIPGLSSNKTDCDDTRANVNPGIMTDGCDNLDNDCDGMIDEDCSLPPCDGNILTINTITQNTYRAAIQIISDAVVGNGQTIEYYAGTEICLDPGFEVVLGGDFFADIEDCMTQPMKEEQEPKQKEKN